MSSDESRTTGSSSRLSQFGLYRSIDARTEEFLRLSRKRQIRQGCACAAVTTAITVTVVVTIILVYEYTVNADSNPGHKSRKPTWHGLFNDTPPLDIKYSKEKINIDSTTLKLLPVILKALNYNRQFETLIGDANLGSTFIRRESPVPTFKLNKFPATMKRTHQKADYKPPIVQKYPYKNMEYFKKMRKVHEYQRMQKYFDKMINNKYDSPLLFSGETESGSEMPIVGIITTPKINRVSSAYRKHAPEENQNYAPHISIVPSHNAAVLLKTSSKAPMERTKESSIMYNTLHCKCLEKLTNIMNKITSNIKNILFEIATLQKACSEEKNTIVATTPKKTLLKSVFTTHRPLNTFKLKFITPIPGKRTSTHTNQVMTSTKRANNPTNLNDELSTREPLTIATTINSYLEPTESSTTSNEITTMLSNLETNRKRLNLLKFHNHTIKPATQNSRSNSRPLHNKNNMEDTIISDLVLKSNKHSDVQFSTENATKSLENTPLTDIPRARISSYLPPDEYKRYPFRKAGELLDLTSIKHKWLTTISPSHFKFKKQHWDNLFKEEINIPLMNTSIKPSNITIGNKTKNTMKPSQNVKQSKIKQKPTLMPITSYELTKQNKNNYIKNISKDWINEDFYESPVKLPTKIITQLTLPGDVSRNDSIATARTTFPIYSKNSLKPHTKSISKTVTEKISYHKKIVTDAITNKNIIGDYKKETTTADESRYNSNIFDDYVYEKVDNEILVALAAYNNNSSTNTSNVGTLETSKKSSEPIEIFYDINNSTTVLPENMVSQPNPQEKSKRKKDNTTYIQSIQTDFRSTTPSSDYEEFKFMIEETERPDKYKISPSIIPDKYALLPPKRHTASNVFVNSMLPISRPIYLEFHHYDWKQDNHDYENTDADALLD